MALKKAGGRGVLVLRKTGGLEISLELEMKKVNFIGKALVNVFIVETYRSFGHNSYSKSVW